MNSSSSPSVFRVSGSCYVADWHESEIEGVTKLEMGCQQSRGYVTKDCRETPCRIFFTDFRLSL